MTRRRRIIATVAAAAASVMGVRAQAQVVAASGYLVRTIPLPASAVGGVVRRGNAVLVGQGTFGTGTESVVRFDGADPTGTTVAAGFNSLGGFDLGPDGTTLYTVDNCFGTDHGCSGATAGDDLYAVADATTRTTALTPAQASVLGSGSISDGQDVLALADGSVLVSDAVGVGSGKIIKVVGTTPTDFATGLDFLGGLATDGTTLFVDNVDGTFVGAVKRYQLDGTPLADLAGGLSGAFGVALDEAGNALVSGGFTSDFSSSTLVAVDSGGTVTERAHGFGFSADVFYDRTRETALVLDFDVAAVTAICRDADADGVCDGDCAGPAAIDGAVLRLGKQATPLGDDTLALKGEMTLPAGPFDPVTTGARVLVEDAMARALVAVAVPPGAFDPGTKTGWKVNKAHTAWTYKNPAGVDGVTTVGVKRPAKDPSQAKFRVVGKHGRYPTAGEAFPLRVVFTVDAAGQCGLVSFAAGECVTNGSGTTQTCK
jgi:hypothetical protein